MPLVTLVFSLKMIFYNLSFSSNGYRIGFNYYESDVRSLAIKTRRKGEGKGEGEGGRGGGQNSCKKLQLLTAMQW